MHRYRTRSTDSDSPTSDRALEDLTLKILRKDSPCKGATELVSTIMDVFEAIERRYLQKLQVALFSDVSLHSSVSTGSSSLSRAGWRDPEGGELGVARNGVKDGGVLLGVAVKPSTADMGPDACMHQLPGHLTSACPAV